MTDDDLVFGTVEDLMAHYGDLTLDGLGYSLQDDLPLSGEHVVDLMEDDLLYLMIDTLGVELRFPMTLAELYDSAQQLEGQVVWRENELRKQAWIDVRRPGAPKDLPIWFLDIDGVVNAAGQDLAPHLLRTEATTDGITWPIHYSPEVVQFINLVHRNGLAEVRWLTTWGQDARTALAPAVGLDDFAAYDMHESDGWWKAEIVTHSIASEGRPVIWTDDDLTHNDVAQLTDADMRSLGVTTEAANGLTSRDFRSIAEWLSS